MVLPPRKTKKYICAKNKKKTKQKQKLMFKFTWFVKMKRKLNILFYKLLNRVEDPCSIYLILFILILMIAIFFTYFLNLGIYFLNLEVYTLKLNISILIFYLLQLQNSL